MMKRVRLVLLAACLGAPAAAQQPADFAPGQVWSYRVVEGDNASRIVVGKVETYPKDGETVHVTITDLSLPDAMSPGGTAMMFDVTHVALTKDALERSVLEYEGTRPVSPVFEEAYAAWREAYDKGQTGVVDVPVAEVVEQLRANGFAPEGGE